MILDNCRLPLVILGAGGFARELLGWMRLNYLVNNEIKSFVQDGGGEKIAGIDVVDFDVIRETVRFIVAVGDPGLKECLVKKALAKGWLPESYIDDTSVIGLDVKVGKGCIISPFCTVSSNVSLGDYVTLNCRAGVGHDSEIGEYTTLLGSNQVNGCVTVADRVLLGAGSIIHPGRKIGSSSVVGIGSVVLTNVKEKTTVFGNPAKKLK